MLKLFIKKIFSLAIVATICAAPLGASAAPSRYVSNQTIFYESFSRIMKMDSYNFEGKFSIKFPEDLDMRDSFFAPSNSFGISFYGSQEKNRVTGDGKSTISMSFNDGSGLNAYPHVDVIGDNKDSYIKVSNLAWVADQLAGLGSSFSSDVATSTTSTPQTNLQKYGLDKVDSSWVKISDQSMKQFMSELGFDSALLQEMELRQADSQKELMEQLEIVLKAAKKYNLLTFTRLKDEIVSGVDTYHLKLTINKAKIRPVLVEVNNKMKKDERMTLKELNGLVQDFSKVSLPAMDMWVGKDDYLPRKLVVDFDIKEPTAAKNDPSVKIIFSIALSGFNNVQMISAPTEYRLVEDVVKEFMKKIEEIEKSRPTPTYDDWDYDYLEAASASRSLFKLPLMSIL